jgi:hypothetical protein
MTLQSALLRATYLRTLQRLVGPHLGWRVVTPVNDLRAPPPCAQTGGEVFPLISPPTLFQPVHAAPHSEFSA